MPAPFAAPATFNAAVAQSVEHQLPKLRVAGSNPVCRSKYKALKISDLKLIFNAFIHPYTYTLTRKKATANADSGTPGSDCGLQPNSPTDSSPDSSPSNRPTNQLTDRPTNRRNSRHDDWRNDPQSHPIQTNTTIQSANDRDLPPLQTATRRSKATVSTATQ